MKEIVISLLQEDENDRFATLLSINDKLKSLTDNKVIEIANRFKTVYNQKELMYTRANFAVKLVDCSDIFRGSFISWFAFKASPLKEVERNEFKSPFNNFQCVLGELHEICHFLYRLRGLKSEGFEGKILLKIYNIQPFNTEEEFKFEPLEKHAKYIDDFTELNPNDF